MVYRTLLRVFRDEKGATAIEYGLLAGLISVVLIVAFSALGGSIGMVFDGGPGSAAAVLQNATASIQ